MNEEQLKIMKDYANILLRIYINRTAGDHTFVGVLANFVSDYEKVRDK